MMAKALKLVNTDGTLDRKYVKFIGEPEKIISRSNVVIDKPVAEWIDGMHLGNGDMGAMVYGPPENMTYCLGKNDLWDLRYNRDKMNITLEKLRGLLASGDVKEYNKYRDYYLNMIHSRYYPSPKQAAMLRLNLCEGANAGYYRQTLDLYNAQCVHQFRPWGDLVCNSECRRQVKSDYNIISYIHADSNVLVIRIDPKTDFRNNVGPFRITISRQLDPLLSKPKFSISGKLALMEHSMPKSCTYTCAYQVLDGKVKWTNTGEMIVGYCKPADGPVTILASVVTSNDAKNPTAKAKKMLRDFSGKSAWAIENSHKRWWHKMWERSFVDIEDEPISRAYYIGIYTLAAMSRPGKQLAGLQGPWLNQNSPPWNGDYHGDINIQCPFWQCLSGNRLELAEPYFRHYLENLPQFKRFARKYYGLPGAKFSMAGDPKGREIWGYMTTSLWPAVGAWICEQYFNHYKYTGDKKFLREVAWPVMYETARFLSAYLFRGKDGRLHVYPTNMPELWMADIEAWGSDCPMDLALIRELFTETIETSKILGEKKSFAGKLVDALDKLATYPMDSKGNITVLRDRKFPEPYLYSLFMIYPANLFDAFATDKQSKAIRKTYKELMHYDTYTGSCWLIIKAVQAARMGDTKAMWKLLDKWGGALTWGDPGANQTVHERWVNDVNGLMNWHRRTVMQVDGSVSFPVGVNEALLQSQMGIIRLFPAVPKDFTGSFHSLRTVGGFLVSGRMINGNITDVVVKSTIGGLCEIADISGKGKVKVSRLGVKSGSVKTKTNAENKSFIFDTQRGGVYKVVVRGT